MRTPGAQAALFRQYVGPHRGQMLLLALLLLSSIGLQLVNPQLLRFFIDSALAGAELRPLALTALAFIAVALVTQLLTAAAQYVGEALGWTATNELRTDLMLHCLRLDLGFHLLAGRTGVVIAHRLETVERCDEIAILEHGRIVEQGPRARLAADPSSRFAELLRTGLREVLA